MKKNLLINESIQREVYEDSGSRVMQLTSSCVVSNNIYCEQPYSSSDGNRIAVMRNSGGSWADKHQLLVIDLKTRLIKLAESDVDGQGGYACAAWGDWFYYCTNIEGKQKLVRVSLLTFEKEELFSFDNPDMPLPRSIGSVSPDHRYYICLVYPPRFSILRIDLLTKEWKIIHQDPEILNPHVQFNPVTGQDILVQYNRGSKMNQEGDITCLCGPDACTLYLIDNNGTNKRMLPIGPPISRGCTGHECFIADTGRFLFSISHQPQGNLMTVAPNDPKPIPACKEIIHCLHVSASKCGKYFVADGPQAEQSPIYVGSLITGKYRTICLSGASLGSPQYTHPHPYLTADNKHVIFNSDRTGVPQVYMATVPQDFLKSLD